MYTVIQTFTKMTEKMDEERRKWKENKIVPYLNAARCKVNSLLNYKNKITLCIFIYCERRKN